jgi:N-acetylmuramic acid 6-phosphate (MurNAc-6-P) etherase
MRSWLSRRISLRDGTNTSAVSDSLTTLAGAVEGAQTAFRQHCRILYMEGWKGLCLRVLVLDCASEQASSHCTVFVNNMAFTMNIYVCVCGLQQ